MALFVYTQFKSIFKSAMSRHGKPVLIQETHTLMDKKAMVAELKAAGIWDTNSKHHLYIKAFEAYNVHAKANNLQKLNASCGSCFSKLRNWLNA